MSHGEGKPTDQTPAPVPQPVMLRRRSFSPAQVMVLGFLLVILMGTVLLALPVSHAPGTQISIIDALFTATSAVCVTGLVVVDTGTAWSPFGQVVIMLLIQAGGFGFMTLSTAVALLVGKRISLKERLALQEAMGQFTPAGVVRLTRQVLKVTLVAEGIGALLLLPEMLREYSFGRAAWLAVFHSISAFNNAGFDLFSTSLRGFVGRPGVIVTISSLVIVGGLGFTVIQDLLHSGWLSRGDWTSRADWRQRWEYLSLSSRMVLTTSAWLLVGGTLMFLLLEWGNAKTLGSLPVWQRFVAAAYTAVTPRTAGFEVLTTGALTQAGLFFTMMLMFVGASPGGTGGGVKTTTFATMFLAMRALVRGEDELVSGGRRLPRDLVRRAWVIAALAATTIALVTLALLITEQASFMTVLFEAVSAFGTVGLSAGLTPDLSSVGKLLVSLTMYVGRVGPLTFVMALAQAEMHGRIQYPEERVMIG